MKAGAQLYTVREFTQTLSGLEQTLAKVADIGYTEVQISGACAFDAEWMNGQLTKNGLSCVVTHVNPDRVLNETQTVIEEHKRFKCPVIGIGGAPGPIGEQSEIDAFAQRFLPAAEQIKQAGLLFAYHNHNREFAKIGGVTVIELLARAFPPDVMTFTLDTYWIQAGGGDPAYWIRKFTGRAQNVHLKDMIIAGANEQRDAPIGCGNLNFPAILEACVEAGTEHLLLEQDNCYGENPFDCLKRSYRYLKSQGIS